ncbi:MAG: DUF5906 domain-containing protein [Kangiellaceae bacterium]|nr:DUF5906 domain-containing protein [Kangiellaceae bacterium]
MELIDFPELSTNPKVQKMLDTWVYIDTFGSFVNRFDPFGRRLNIKQFNSSYASLKKSMPYRNPHSGCKKRFTPSDFIKEMHEDTNRAVFFDSLPNEESIYLDKQTDLKILNAWARPSIEPIKSDVSIFQEYILYLMDCKEEQAKFFTQFLAHCVKYPQLKIKFMPLISSNERGLGKNFLTDKIMRPLIGSSNYRSLDSPNYIVGNHDEWKVGATFVVLDELLQTSNRKFIERLKPLVTNDTTRVNPKGLKDFEITNFMNFIAFSNHSSAIQIDEGERRFFVVHNRQKKKSNEWFDNVKNWLENENGLEAIYHYLLNEVDLSDFDRNKTPMLTDDFHTATESCKSELSTYIRDSIEEKKHLFDKNSLFTLRCLRAVIRNVEELDQRKVTLATINNATQENSIVKVGHLSIPEGKRKEFYSFGDKEELINNYNYMKSLGFHKEWYKSHVYDSSDKFLI